MGDEAIILREPGAPDWRIAIRGDAYTSPERLRAERERLFPRTWQLAGRVEQVEGPGDHFTCDVAGEPVLVVNTGDEGIRAFYNVCRHRGRQLVGDGPCRPARALACPYHGWTYALDGRLLSAPGFADRPASDLGLVPVSVAVWDRLVFVHLDADPEPLEGYLGELTAGLAGIFQPAVLVAEKCLDLDANWKTALEAFIETHHITSLHPQVAKALVYDQAAIAHFARHSMTVVPAAKATRWAERRTQGWHEWLRDPAYLEYHYTIFPKAGLREHPARPARRPLARVRRPAPELVREPHRPPPRRDRRIPRVAAPGKWSRPCCGSRRTRCTVAAWNRPRRVGRRCRRRSSTTRGR
jgi:phenylpropionate dioxygenase-like ring-hydroxylating dioxygenase large terminal subunit